MMTHKKWGTGKTAWPTVATRLDPKLKIKLLEKHPKEGEVSNVLRALIIKYLDGKIFGLNVEV